MKTTEWFQSASLKELEELTGIRRHQWSRYFNAKASMRESTLKKAASSLDIPLGELLSQIEERRQKTSDTPFEERHLIAVRRWASQQRKRKNA